MRIPMFALAGVVTALSIHPAVAQPSSFELSNANVDLAVDAQGRLVRLANPRTGHSYLVSPGHVLWKMYYRTSDARELEIPAATQKAEVRREGNALIIAYPALTGNVALAGSSRQLNVAFTLRAALEEDRLVWTATIANRETEPGLEISELWYELNADRMFDVEYADIMGIPFDFAAQPVVAKPKPPKPTTQVRAMKERAALEITFPRVEGYRVALPDERIDAHFTNNSRLVLTPEKVGPCRVLLGRHRRRGRGTDDGGAGSGTAERDQLSPRQAPSLQPVPRSRRAAQDALVRADQAGGEALARRGVSGLPRRHDAGDGDVSRTGGSGGGVIFLACQTQSPKSAW